MNKNNWNNSWSRNDAVPANEAIGDQASFLNLTPQQATKERIDRLYAKAEGQEERARRTATVKHFNLGGNRGQAIHYGEPVHYRQSRDGEWLDIDNTLEEATNAQGRRVLRNRANSLQVEFPVELDGGDIVSITEDGLRFGWRFEEEAQPIRAAVRNGEQLRQERLIRQAKKLPKYVGRTDESLASCNLTEEMETAQERRADIAQLSAENVYNGILPGVTTRYTLRGQRLKEDIILQSAAALKNAAIRLPAMYDYCVTDAQELMVIDRATGNVAFIMDAPYVYDSAEHETMAKIALIDRKEYVRMEYVLDEGFLASAVWPVTIDPVIHSAGANLNIQDTTLCENMTLRPYTQDHIRVGRTYGIMCVGLLKFNGLWLPKAGETVVSAVLNMAPKASDASKYIGCYEVLMPWEQTAVDWTNFNPYVSAGNISGEALECRQGSNNSWISFDLTNLYRKWCTKNASGISNNNGVAFRTPDNISGDNYSELYSADANSSVHPVMYVNYLSHAGLEGWWQYEQRSDGRAGTAYADLFNGNLVLAHSDTSMTGSRNPVSVTHYYNSCNQSANTFGCGYGWKTSAHQKITALTLNGTNYYVWEDGDGTEHFFKFTGGYGPFSDEEGMQLKLTLNSPVTQITITDKADNKMVFNIVQNGLAWLSTMTDACGNTSTIQYVSGHTADGRIDSITDAVGRVTQFSYDGNGLLTSIRTPAAEANTYRYVYYTYDSNSRLTGVRYSELGGTTVHTTYAYDGTTNLLTAARNYDGAQLNIGYEPTSLFNVTVTDDARRVTSLETVATSATGTTVQSGAKQLIAYGAMTTEVTAVENTSSDDGKKLYYQFNDAGNVMCVRDDLGFAQFTKYASGIENHPSEVSKLRKAVVNRLRRPDFSDQWASDAEGGTIVKDGDNRCLNCRSVKMTKTGSGGTVYRQTVTLEAGTPFTFSAYVKTSGLTNGGAYLRIRPVNATAFLMRVSEILTGTTEPALGNELPTDGWERLRVTLPALATTAQAYIELVCDASSGTAWFACPQLETGVVANAFNLVSNGDFRYTTVSGSQTLPLDWDSGWNNLTTANTGVFAASTDSSFPTALEGNYVQVEGRPDKTLMGYVQYFDMAGSAGDVFVVGGWADGKSVPDAVSRDRGFTLALALKQTNGVWYEPAIYSFNGEWVGWQQNCYATAAGLDYTQIALYILYTGNCNTAKFTNIFLHREAYGTSFGYDDKGNVLSTSNLAGQQSNATYDSADNVLTYVQPGRDASIADNQFWAYYGDTDADRRKHLPWRTRTPMHLTDYFGYDSYGNLTSSRRVDYQAYAGAAEETAYPYIRTESTYSTDGNYPTSTKDSRGYTVAQEVNPNDGTLTSVTDPTGQTVYYSYDDARRVTQVITTSPTSGATYWNAYTYENDRIRTISHNANATENVVYTFDYDALGRKTTVKVGTVTLSTNVYRADRSGLLEEVQYGNGGKVKYQYDGFDRLTGVMYDSETSPRYTYEYGANGEAAQVTDNHLGRISRTEYDQADRPCETELRDSLTGSRLYQTRLKYNKLNQLEQFAERVGGDTHTTKYAYDRDNRVTEIQYDGTTHKVSYSYDALGRLSTRTVESGDSAGTLTSTYTYEDGGYGTNSTTPLVKKITQNGISFEYTYDSRGNITSEKRGSLTTSYEYDLLGRLTRINDPHDTTAESYGTTWLFHYDLGGNIVRKTPYAYTTSGSVGFPYGSTDYEYGDSNWRDKLTVYNGVSITYDAIGNPLNDGTWTYTWAAGRQLQSMSKAGTTVQYQYDHNGLRTRKTATEGNATTVTDYILHGKLVTHMTVSKTVGGVTTQDTLHFFYDAQSRPAKVSYNGTMYTYLHNLQGDVVGILDSAGTLVVEYKYDAWGRALSTVSSLTTELAEENPFRYRGYVYDEETGLYYLRSRYYNPTWCRFVNADRIFTNAQTNLYAYANNSPISFQDADGNLPASTTFQLYLEDGNGLHWMVSLYDVIFSFEPRKVNGNIYGRIVLKNPEHNSIKTELTSNYTCPLTVTGVPRERAIAALRFIVWFAGFDLDERYIESSNLNAQLFGEGPNSNECIDREDSFTRMDYDFERRPCAWFATVVTQILGFSLSAIWGSPYSKDYTQDKTFESNFLVAVDYRTFNMKKICDNQSLSYAKALELSSR